MGCRINGRVEVRRIRIAAIGALSALVYTTLAVADPAVVYITGSYPPSPQVVESTNPDEYGIFTSLDSPREKNEPGKKVFVFKSLSLARDDLLKLHGVLRSLGPVKLLHVRISSESGGFASFLHVHSELDQIEQDLRVSLRLVVAAHYAKRQPGLAVL